MVSRRLKNCGRIYIKGKPESSAYNLCITRQKQQQQQTYSRVECQVIIINHSIVRGQKPNNVQMRDIITQ